MAMPACLFYALVALLVRVLLVNGLLGQENTIYITYEVDK